MDLEELYEEERQLEEKLHGYSKKIRKLQQKKNAIYKELQEVQRKIALLNSDIVVTDHAVVRYFERILNKDIEEIRGIICPPSIKDRIKLLTNCKFPVKNFEIVVKNNVVVTVITK